MDNFIYYTPTKIYFGKGEENKVAKIIKEYNPSKIMLVFGSGSIKRNGLLDKVEKLLNEEDLKYIEFGGAIPNPTLEHAREGIKLGINYCDCGQMMYRRNQKPLMGASGCGCSASILNSYLLKQMDAFEKEFNKFVLPLKQSGIDYKKNIYKLELYNNYNWEDKKREIVLLKQLKDIGLNFYTFVFLDKNKDIQIINNFSIITVNI